MRWKWRRVWLYANVLRLNSRIHKAKLVSLVCSHILYIMGDQKWPETGELTWQYRLRGGKPLSDQDIKTEYPEWHFFSFIFISWRLITLQYCSGFCHTLTWISHGFTCIPHPDNPSHLPLHPIPLGLPSAPGPSACLMHPTWAGDLFHTR